MILPFQQTNPMEFWVVSFSVNKLILMNNDLESMFIMLEQDLGHVTSIKQRHSSER